MTLDRATRAIRIEYTGSGGTPSWKVLAPAGWRAEQVTLDGNPAAFETVQAGQSRYIAFRGGAAQAGSVVIRCQ